jgi:hypothetical protein
MNRNPGTPDTKKQPPPRRPTPDAKKERAQPPTSGAEQVEGEGSYTATHRYNEGVREHIANHDVESEAEAARLALEGDERQELEQAEERGKAPAKR